MFLFLTHSSFSLSSTGPGRSWRATFNQLMQSEKLYMRMRAFARSGPPATTGALHTPGGAGREAPPAQQAQTLLAHTGQAHTGRYAESKEKAPAAQERCAQLQVRPGAHDAAARAAHGQPYPPLPQHLPDANWSLHDIATKFDIFDVYDIPRPNSADEERASSRSSDCEELSARSSPLSLRLTRMLAAN